ncbi:MAG: hypothetical protein A2X64_05450 [Ignavibacteria bacterium GWF2_33_9]|nr:MAG: hypothetical protein A2X64_05450 [Ignavibacteria bacterium GWF2_33_9]
MKKSLTIFITLFIAFSLNTSAIEVAKNLTGLDLPANPMIIPEGKSNPLPKINNADNQMYILFDNLDPEISNQVSNYIELAYYDIYKKWPNPDYNYYNLMVRAPYSDATLSQYTLTDFDVAIFPIGSWPLNAATQGGIKIIDKIKEMLNAGKRVMVIGRYWASYAFHQDGTFAGGKDPVVIDFLQNEIGIDPPQTGVIAITDGQSYLPYHIEGIDGDPVAKGYDYYGNIAYGRNVEPMHPIAYRTLLDQFKLASNALGTGFAYLDKYGKTDGDPNVPMGSWVGVRADVGDGRIVLWSLAPDNIALTELQYFTNTELYAMDWFTKDLPKYGQWIDLEATLVNFGESLLDQQKTQEVRIRNFGKKPLTISAIEWNEWEEPGTFVVIEGGGAGVLQPGEFRTIKIGFTPTEERDYEDQLFIESDAINAPSTAINVKGRGGKDAPTGPEIRVSAEPFDFGVVEIPTSKTKDIYFNSVGTDNVIVDNIEFYDNIGNAFSFPQTMNFPQVVKPGTQYTFSVKFSPIDYGKSYSATLKITSNAVKNYVAFIKLVGKTKSSGIGPSISSDLAFDTLDFGYVTLNNEVQMEFNILSTGADSLRINKFYLNDDYDVFTVPDGYIDQTPVLIAPSEMYKIPVNFKPYTDMDVYYGELGMFTNATNEGGNNFKIYLKGTGHDPFSVKGEVQNKLGTLSMKAFPNPSGGDFKLEITSKAQFMNASLNIYDLKGKVVMTIFQGNIEEGQSYYDLNNALLPSGQYFIGVKTLTESVILPFIIVK